MRSAILIGAALALMATAAGAAQQPTPPDANGPQNGAIYSSDIPQPGVPVTGRHSFTQGDAKSPIEAKGLTNVTGLQRDLMATFVIMAIAQRARHID
jgi:hypothetical protein